MSVEFKKGPKIVFGNRNKLDFSLRLCGVIYTFDTGRSRPAGAG
jgi:hypothetical protein